MQVDKREKFTILGDDENDVEAFASFLDYVIPKSFKEEHLVIDLLKYDKMDLDQLLKFLVLSNERRAARKSFVIVNKAVAIDRIPAELIVVPTVGEAIDVIDLEEIQRELGF